MIRSVVFHRLAYSSYEFCKYKVEKLRVRKQSRLTYDIVPPNFCFLHAVAFLLSPLSDDSILIAFIMWLAMYNYSKRPVQ